MKRERYSNQDETMQLVIIPVYIGVLNWIVLGKTYWSDWRVFLFSTTLTAFLAYITWLVNNAVGLYLDRLFPKLSQTAVRLVWLFVWCLLIGIVVCSLLYGCYELVGSYWSIKPVRYGWMLFFEAMVVLVVISMYEGVRTFERWERTLRETEALKKANLQRQFEGLKSQINPHFLFNSLNTLSSLIEEDAPQAEHFVEEMASVYRYLLRSNETQLATLGNELAFVRSYFHLLRTRYGTHIHLEQVVDSQFDVYQLPPLTLQLLLENAVKHNIVLPQQPLRITIETSSDGHLLVRNNLQRKTTHIPSNRVGLTNIAMQFRLLGAGEVRIDDDDRQFTVSLPLIRPD